MTEMLLRFVIGGVLVSIFAVLGDLFRPKSFAGLFGAAPSLALATLGLTLWTHGGAYAAIEGRSMMIGALALAIYSLVVCHSTARFQIAALPATLMSLLPWFVVALGLERLLIG